MKRYVDVLYKENCLDIDGILFHHHQNGGGLVAETANVAETAYVGLRCVVLDNASVLGFSRISGISIVKDSTIISGMSMIYGDSVITDNAEVSGKALVYNSEISGNSRILSHAHIYYSKIFFGVYELGTIEFLNENKETVFKKIISAIF